MPLVTGIETRESRAALRAVGALAGALFPRCANPECASGWMHVWRNRQTPAFEGKWACSAACMEALVAAAVRREMEGSEAALPLPMHRVPMGLMLVRQGTITVDQLRAALEEQQQARRDGSEARKLGTWLLESGVLSEPALTRALSLQWNCPVLSLDGFRPGEMATAMPRFLAEAFGALPVRTAGERLLYLAFSGRVDRCLSYALGRITGLQVAAGIAPESEFRPALEKYSAAAAPRAQYVEAASSWALVRMIAERVESTRAAGARLVRVHDVYWLRLWRRAPGKGGLPAPGIVEDLLATVGTIARNRDRTSDYRKI
jgi:hypothetical protein